MAEEITHVDEALQAAFASVDSQSLIAQAGSTGLKWLPDFVTRRKGELADTKARLEIAYQAKKKQLETEERALDYRLGAALRDEIDKQFQEGKGGNRKSIRNLFGKVGYRKVAARIVVTVLDEEKAIEQAEEHCPEAIKIRKSLSKTALRKLYEDTGQELEGTRIDEIPEYQKFYVQPEKKLLEGE